ncbi:MAG: DUF3093 domain-containing protein [Aeromicrobium erythreum]
MQRHRERLVAPASWWVGVLLFAAVCGWIMFVATTPTLAIVSAVVGLLVAGAAVWSYGSVLVEAGPDGFRVGRARLDAEHVGAVQALGPRELRERMGPSSDARAWLLTRPYVDRGVVVEVRDPHDPTPYWLVSSRRPEALAAALAGTPAARPDQEANRDGEA